MIASTGLPKGGMRKVHSRAGVLRNRRAVNGTDARCAIPSRKLIKYWDGVTHDRAGRD